MGNLVTGIAQQRRHPIASSGETVALDCFWPTGRQVLADGPSDERGQAARIHTRLYRPARTCKPVTQQCTLLISITA